MGSRNFLRAFIEAIRRRLSRRTNDITKEATREIYNSAALMEPNIIEFRGIHVIRSENSRSTNADGPGSIPILLDIETLTPGMREQYEGALDEGHGLKQE
ncbi:hypothetical protein KEM56_000508 [Ascosphaera pollenicola]|nr:hypothetical protein KEM56_000508 [Ascosphaera pollenicola]